MSLKKYDELTDVEKKKVSVMYSDQLTVEQYLYNFDEKGEYHGRQYFHPGTTHAESTVVEKVKEEVKEVIEKVVKPKRTKKK